MAPLQQNRKYLRETFVSAVGEAFMPPGNAVRIRRNADQTRTAPVGCHEWLPYSKMGSTSETFVSAVGEAFMPPGNAVRIRRGADNNRPAPVGSHEWLPYSKMGSTSKTSFLL